MLGTVLDLVSLINQRIFADMATKYSRIMHYFTVGEWDDSDRSAAWWIFLDSVDLRFTGNQVENNSSASTRGWTDEFYIPDAA